ncbi:MAG: DUF4230 domain-containing protein [Saprospiraceae bacterium]|nr:DUF4230 domain-containing protein [Saprospiraceae bacterium]
MAIKPVGGAANILKTILGLGLGGFLVFYAFKLVTGGSVGGYSFIPQDVQVTYVQSDFKYDFNDEDALAILENPQRYNREFNQLVYDFNMALLQHVANRMNLPDSLMPLVAVEYDKHHAYLKRLYYEDYIALKDTTSSIYRQWYDSEASSSVEFFHEVAAKYTCFLINHVISTLLKTEDGNISVKGRQVDTPCGVAMTEGLDPLINRLKESAAIRDFSRSKGYLEERVEKVVAELATMELRDKKGLNKQMMTKFLGINVSSTEFEVSAISILKVGFDLQKLFKIDMDTDAKKIIVTLPQPEILSHEVFPRFDKLDIGWLREVEDQDFNQNIDLLRQEFRRDALESDIMEKAKTQAKDLMETMLSPLIIAQNRGYSLEVKFGNTNPEYTEEQAKYDGLNLRN